MEIIQAYANRYSVQLLPCTLAKGLNMSRNWLLQKVIPDLQSAPMPFHFINSIQTLITPLFTFQHKRISSSLLLMPAAKKFTLPARNITRKPYCRKGTARCRCCSFRFKVRRQHLSLSSQASKARLQSSKHTGAKQNLTQNGHSRSFKVTCFVVSGKAIRN